MIKAKINPAGLGIITRYEQLRLEAYQDAVGVWTIGWGHTRTAREGMTITREEAERLLVADLEEAQDAVAKRVEVPVNENQFAALVSLTFNIGQGNFGRSTLLRRLNEGDYEGAAQEFRKWDGKPGRKLRGLTSRRGSEEQLFRQAPPVILSTVTLSGPDALSALAETDDGQGLRINPTFRDAKVSIVWPEVVVFVPAGDTA